MPVSAIQDRSGDDASTAAVALSALTGGFRRAMGAYYVGMTAWNLANRIHKQVLRATQYTVTVHGTDEVYPDLQAWLVASVPAGRRRAMQVRTRRGGDDQQAIEVDVTGRPEPSRLHLRYDGTRSQRVDLDGHRLRVSVDRPDWLTFAREGADPSRYADLERTVVTCPNLAARDAFVALLEAMAAQHGEREPRFYVADRWGGWNRREHAARPMATVVLAKDQRERIDDDLAAFLAHEHAYARLGAPWHRGYLLHGPPGTGKTSLARALSTHHRLDLYYVPLSAVPNDAALMQLLNGVGDRSMLLLEDIDVVHAARTRDDGEPGVSASGLLNALDGVATPHGLVTVMTTNRLEVLDPALVRRGRADLIEELGEADAEQFARMAEALTGRPWTGACPARPVPPAEVVEAVKRTLPDVMAAREALALLAQAEEVRR